jgi:5-methyltetrahydrofolate--homocysteine methyltransferase
MFVPNLKGSKLLNPIEIDTIVPYIDWIFFFKAWGLPGRFEGMDNYCGCEACQQAFLLKYRHIGIDKAREALSLYQDAQTLLREVRSRHLLRIQAKIRFCPAHSVNEGILVQPGGTEDSVYLPMLRQQHPGERSGCCVSLCDFVSPEADYVGFFAISVQGTEALSEDYRQHNDPYNAILIKSVSDRLAEAAAEWLHQQVRTTYWGYAPDEHFSPKELMNIPYKGIRPAIGYPSMPDQSLIFLADRLLHVSEVGIHITENGAMQPNSSIFGLYIAHPASFYFMVGKVGEDQLADYARRSGKSRAELDKWMTHNT